MKVPVENIGTIGAFFMAMATAAPCCLPLLATSGAALGLSVLLPYQEILTYVLQCFVILVLVGHVRAYLKHRNYCLLLLSFASSIGIFFGYNFYYSANIIYPSLIGLGVAAIWHYFINRSDNAACSTKNIILESIITCPLCGFQRAEIMPVDFCLFFYECLGCKALLKPKKGDCCVFCSYGSVKCPPIQTGSCLCN